MLTHYAGSSGAAPQPVFRFFTQTCFDWIIFDVRESVAKVPFVPNVTIERFTRPKPAGALQQVVAFVSSEALPRVQDLAHLEFGCRREKRVHMVRHHTPSMQEVALTIEMKQGAFYSLG